jgi:type VI secretion system secreted protein VgrG
MSDWRIEDRKGQEQIYIHAQKDWDEHVEHDQKIRIGHERHDTVEANSYTELKAEEHRTTHQDRKTEVRANDHLSVATTRHVKLGTGQFVEAGNEIHYHAGSKVVIDAGMELTAKGGGSWLKLDPGGVTLSGATIKINSGGAPGAGRGLSILPAVLPWIADQARAGNLLDQARRQERHDEQVRFVTRHGNPIPGVKAAIILPSESAPQLSRSDPDGRHPRLQTNAMETADVHLVWDELVIPSGADDYATSRKK